MIQFEKYHGLGNDFIIFNYKDLMANNIKEENFPDLAVKVCDRHTGIGADGMMVLVEKEDRCQMIFINSDGSIVSMCGNGIRCFSNYIYNNKILDGTTYKVETLAGLLSLDISPDEKFNVKVDMGKPLLDPVSIPMSTSKEKFINEEIVVDGKVYKVSALLMGVPHAVIFVDNLENIDLVEVGKTIENHPLFPQKTNVNFVQILDVDEILVDTWERGAGHTLACGTGSCASVVMGELLGYLSSKVIVHLTLGDLIIEVKDEVYMTGPSEFIAKGEYKYK
ncbi:MULTISPECIES: diaminopimelate epimerase [Psychrilyobacter]|uniref:diaminopimelate epimerase n=1 Tax=Psychrilyobacter TaxID=623282 RepID=UPI0018F30B58|nr:MULTISPECIES: diaminopimelate epimerase [Psychrilyobacter]MCS5422225.1 diaminopimelate epimerase [Psychrilyobacter sp. S5]